MTRKPKAKPVRRLPITKAKLHETIKEQATLLMEAKRLMETMQTEIKQLTSMHRTQLQIIDNLSTKIREGN